MSETSLDAVAAEAKKQILDDARKQIGPDGLAWAKTKDGRQALRNLERELVVRVVRGAVVVRLSGHYARHHLGAVRGAKRRQMIPTGKFPDQMIEAVRAVVQREFDRITSAR